jgi:shikimate dehydrogenase
VIGGSTRVAAVLGHPVRHARSPALHNAAYRALGLDAVYVALEVAPADLPRALAGVAALGLLGVNLTVPHKEAALALCDELDEVARASGAVNTVVVRDGRLHGTNTDVIGFERSLEETLGGVPARAVVLGTGGAARAVVVALARRGAEVRVIGRDPARARDLLSIGAHETAPWTSPALAAALDEADLLVDATSMGLSAEAEAAVPVPVPLERLPAGATVATLVYHRRTALLAAAAARGLRTFDGGGMLVHQAARALTLMTGREAPLEVLRATLSA